MNNLNFSSIILKSLVQGLTPILPLLILIFFLSILIFFLKSLFIKKENPYYKKQYFLTPAELSFFKVLEQAVSKTYYIFPQIKLASLVEAKGKGSIYYSRHNRIDRKTVDFVIADIISCNPLLVIELDDSSHNNWDRWERDAFCNEVLKQTGIPILRIPVKSDYNPTNIKEMIEEKIHPAVNL